MIETHYGEPYVTWRHEEDGSWTGIECVTVFDGRGKIVGTDETGRVGYRSADASLDDLSAYLDDDDDDDDDDDTDVAFIDAD